MAEAVARMEVEADLAEADTTAAWISSEQRSGPRSDFGTCESWKHFGERRGKHGEIERRRTLVESIPQCASE